MDSAAYLLTSKSMPVLIITILYLPSVLTIVQGHGVSEGGVGVVLAMW